MAGQYIKLMLMLLMPTLFASYLAEVFLTNTNLNGQICTETVFLSSSIELSLFRCLTLCYQFEKQSCIGVFYKKDQAQCFLCGQMDNPNLAPMLGTVALQRSTVPIAPDCLQNLVLSANESQLSVSSDRHGHEFTYAKLDTVETVGGTGGWTKADDDQDPWIQIDLLNLKYIAGIITQGRSEAYRYTFLQKQYVTEYRVMISTDCSNFKYVRNNQGDVMYFPGNIDVESHVTNMFDKGLAARCVRINPTKWNDNLTLRFDVLDAICANISAI